MSDLGPNHDLPPVNPLNLAKARSTIATVLSLVALIGPLIGGGVGEVLAEVAASANVIQSQTEVAINSFNAIFGVGSLAWLWLERRAPNFRLSFRIGPA